MVRSAAGLAALRDALAPDGVMMLMLYGQTVRIGVYMLQDAFWRMESLKRPKGSPKSAGFR
jgi:hypothetical protein